MKKLLLLLATSLCLTRFAMADTSFLLVQGPFGSGSSLETFQWQVNYAHGTLITGQQLLNVVFGIPIDTGTTYQGSEVFSATNNLIGANYIDFSGGAGTSLFTISVTLDNQTVEQDSSFSPGWNYYVAGGSGTGGSYTSGSWSYSGDGLSTRTLSDGSFDAWSFGSTFPNDPIVNGTGTYAPTASNFAGATVIDVVPEPVSLTFLAAGGLLLVGRRRRR